jgi:hypothetical protein
MRARVSNRETQFIYFDRVLGSRIWNGRKILDFGGNVGGFLAGAGNRVNHDDYWCLDLDEYVVETGRERFPRAHFHHYDRYSSQYNPNGVRNLPTPDLGLKFDIILAFSVFTHTHLDEMIELVTQLREKLTAQGTLAFTFTDPGFDRSEANSSLPAGTDVRKVLTWHQIENPSLEIDGMVESARRSKWCLVIDETLYPEPGAEWSSQVRDGRQWESYCSYFNAAFISTVFPDGKIFPPVSPEWQHCCVLSGPR